MVVNGGPLQLQDPISFSRLYLQLLVKKFSSWKYHDWNVAHLTFTHRTLLTVHIFYSFVVCCYNDFKNTNLFSKQKADIAPHSFAHPHIYTERICNYNSICLCWKSCNLVTYMYKTLIFNKNLKYCWKWH